MSLSSDWISILFPLPFFKKKGLLPEGGKPFADCFCDRRLFEIVDLDIHIGFLLGQSLGQLFFESFGFEVGFDRLFDLCERHHACRILGFQLDDMVAERSLDDFGKLS